MKRYTTHNTFPYIYLDEVSCPSFSENLTDPNIKFNITKVISDGDYRTLKDILDINQSYILGAIKYATFVGEFNIAIDLINEYDIDIHFNDDILLAIAVDRAHLSILKDLVNLGLNINMRDSYPIKNACQTWHKDRPACLLLLIELKVDIHFDDDYPLRNCVYRGNDNFVKILLDANANVHAKNDEALKFAVDNCDVSMMAMLLESRANVHIDNDYPLRYSAITHNLPCVELLLNYNADINANNSEPLINAISAHDLSMVNLLLNSGANINALHNYVPINNSILELAELLENYDIPQKQIILLLTKKL
jgi:hypothetical protein